MKHRTLIALWVGTMACAPSAWAQGESAPSQPEAKPAQPSAGDPVPNLDDLLGLPRDRESGRRPPAQDPSRAELERELSPSEAAEEFRQAVDLMAQTARRLNDARDTGLQTQRIQEDIVRKLDMLIKSAEQQAQRSRSRSSSSSSSSSRDRDQPNQPGQQQSEQNQAGRGENRGEVMPPARQDGPLNPEVSARGASWGSLPQRVRDALVQGKQDQYSALYKRLTEAYYRKLAEEPR